MGIHVRPYSSCHVQGAARGPDGRGAGPGPLRALPGQDLRVLSTDFTCTAVPGIYGPRRSAILKKN